MLNSFLLRWYFLAELRLVKTRIVKSAFTTILNIQHAQHTHTHTHAHAHVHKQTDAYAHTPHLLFKTQVVIFHMVTCFLSGGIDDEGDVGGEVR